MNSITTNGLIYIKGECNIEYAVCKITHVMNEDETFSYTFTPNYSVIDLLDSNIFQGIPGLELSLRKKEYYRNNIVPTFISERVPANNREDFYELLSDVNMTYMNPIEYLIRSNTLYSGDELYVKEYKPLEKVELIDEGKINIRGILKKIISNICIGNNILYAGTLIDNNNRTDMFKILFSLYKKSFYSMKEKQESGIIKAKEKQVYKGRKAIKVDQLLFLSTLEEFNKKKITAKEAANIIGISIDKFYRLRKLQK